MSCARSLGAPLSGDLAQATMSFDLFGTAAGGRGVEDFPGGPAASAERNPELHQWFTPAWAAEAIVEQEFGWLSSADRVLEPSAGDGAFLCAVPANVPAIGVEIDPRQAALAQLHSGRRVLVGDFMTMPRDVIGPVTCVIGNPPFQSDAVAGFVGRCAELLPEGGQVGFVLPAYIFQTSSKVELLSRSFSIHQQLLPRNLFPGLKLPLVFAKFIKEQHRRLFGFLLYREAQDIRELRAEVAEMAAQTRGRRGAWHQVVESALRALGGEADLSSLYEHVARRRPTDNPFWKEKIRQVVQRSESFCRVGPGRYALAT